MLTLMNGRPEDCTGRLAKEIQCYDLLDTLGIAYQRVDHTPAQTMEICGEIDKSLGASTSCTWQSVSCISPRMEAEPGVVSRKRSIYVSLPKDSRETPSWAERNLVLKGLSAGISSR